MQEQRLAKLLEMYAQNEQDTFVLFALGMEYGGMGNKELAMGYYQKCIACDKCYVPAYYQLALLLISKGLEDEARACLEEGLLLLKGSKDLKTLNEFRSLLDEINF